ncbi:unnamed protein product, partial [marine sediment metagenome]
HDEVDMNQVVGHGGEVDDSDMTSEETAASVLAIIKPDEGRLLTVKVAQILVKWYGDHNVDKRMVEQIIDTENLIYTRLQPVNCYIRIGVGYCFMVSITTK